MISLSKFRNNLFHTFITMRDTGLVVDVYHRRKVYKLHIEPTDLRVTTPYKARKKQFIPDALITSEPCKQCNSLLVSAICMNTQCPSNQKAPGGAVG